MAERQPGEDRTDCLHAAYHSRLDALPVPMQVGVSTRYWEFADPDDPRLTIEPDVSIPASSADHFAGIDPVLEAALRD